MDGFTIGQVIAGAATELAKKFALLLVNKTSKLFKDKKAQNEILVQTAYENYLNATYEKNINIKTLLYKQAPQNLYDFYECLGIKNKKIVIDTSDINNLLDTGHKFIITGTGGVGKTIMMKHLFINCITNTDCIPILIELRGLNDVSNLDIVQIIFDNLKMFNFSLEREYFDYSLSLGKYVIIFDGFDEVKSELAKKVQESIFYLTNKYPENYYIVSSRPMNNSFVAWSDFVEFEAQGLNKSQALSLVKKLNYDEQIKQKFYIALDNELYEKYKTFASNPLLLTIMLMTFAEGGEIPENFNDFYEQAFIALYKAHDASKGAYVRDKAANLGSNDFKLIFSYVCFKSFFSSQYEFNESNLLSLIEQAKTKHNSIENFKSEDFLTDLTDSVCLIIRDGLTLRFAHRSFQEYFAAYYATQLEDSVQEKVIKYWLNDYIFYNSSEFLNILNRMQPERFKKNILMVGLKEIKKSCKDLDDAEILQLFFKHVFITDEKTIGLFLHNRYFVAIFDIVQQMFKLKNKNNNKKEKERDGMFYSKLYEKGLISNKYKNRDISINKIAEDTELRSLLIEYFKTILEIIHYGINLYDEYSVTLPKTKDLAALLDVI